MVVRSAIKKLMGAVKPKKKAKKVLVDKSTNQINLIHPYRTKYGLWVYDDEELGVYNEAFVCGSSELIDHLVGEECNSFSAYISSKKIPKYTVKLVNIDEQIKKEDALKSFKGEVKINNPNQYEPQGWYMMEGTEHRNWLCSRLTDYFTGYPKEIFVKIEKRKK